MSSSTKAAEKVVLQQTAAPAANAAPLLRRAFLFLEDEGWRSADSYFEKERDIEPENAQAYLGKLMAERKVRTRQQLADCAEPFDDRDNYAKVIRFGGDALAEELRGYIAHINERNELDRLTGIYDTAQSTMRAARTEEAYKQAASAFASIPGFRDADTLAGQCLENAEICRKDAGYASAKAKMTGAEAASYEAAIKAFRKISGWKDADEQILVCKKKIEAVKEEIRVREEAERLEAERKAEERRIAAEKAAKKRKKIRTVATLIAAACVAFVFLYPTVIIPNNKYNAAVSLMNEGKYAEAITAFEALDGYKDSVRQIKNCAEASDRRDYGAAKALFGAGKFEAARLAFFALGDYGDSVQQVENCEEAINRRDYGAAKELLSAG